MTATTRADARATLREFAQAFLAELTSLAPHAAPAPRGPVTRNLTLPGNARDAQRFWATVQVGAEHACWPWLGAKTRGGYGTFFCAGKPILAHRYAYLLAAGSIPDRYQVLHSCDRPDCQNPAHLSAGTNAENMADRNAKARQARGERNCRAKLTAKDVHAIRQSHESNAALARRFGVSHSSIARIRKFQAWRLLDAPPPVPMGVGVEARYDGEVFASLPLQECS
jgi:hypothetical protein